MHTCTNVRLPRHARAHADMEAHASRCKCILSRNMKLDTTAMSRLLSSATWHGAVYSRHFTTQLIRRVVFIHRVVGKR